MSIIKETIKYNSKDTYITIDLGINNSLIGYQQEIDEITEETKESLINSINDVEVRRFGYGEGYLPTIDFYFIDYNVRSGSRFNITNNGHYNQFPFTSDEINSNGSDLRNSFFIMEYYDSFDTYNQTKIGTTYITKIITNSTNTTPSYLLSLRNQFNKVYIPKSFINGIESNEITGYMKFSFYNAETGKIILFYNKDNEGSKTPEKYYTKININTNTMKWVFNQNNVSFYEEQSNSYIDRVNDTFSNFNNKKQIYPSGGTIFNPDGKYSID